MLDTDIAWFLSACRIEPTPEAIAVARRLWDVGHLVIDTESGHPSLARWRKAATEAVRLGKPLTPALELDQNLRFISNK